MTKMAIFYLSPLTLISQLGSFHWSKVTQDESTFTMYDHQPTKWDHIDAKQPENKNEGPSLMMSCMMTEEWGELRHREM